MATNNELALAEQSPEFQPSISENLLMEIESVPPYGQYDRDAMLKKLAALQALLGKNNGATTEAQVETTKLFINRCFEDFEAPSLNQKDGSFGFIVPSRIRREVLGESDEYMAEWEPLCPILQHFDSATAQRFVVGLPPFIADHYGSDAEGRRGYMLCAPMLHDMSRDLRGDFLNTGIDVMDDTLKFAKKIGIDTVGLGATLPKFLFMADRYAEKNGRTIDDQGLELTTGHAGTVWLIEQTMKYITNKEKFKGLNGPVGVFGAGSIGQASIVNLREKLGFEGTINVFDNNQAQLNRAMSLDCAEITPVTNERELLTSSDTIICAATTTLSLSELGYNDPSAQELAGKVIVDDSQPGCFDPEEVRSHGGQLVWVIGKDPTDEGELTCSQFDYNGFGPVARDEIWGCQLETWAVRKQRIIRGVRSLAVRGEVKYDNVRNLGEFLTDYNTGIAELQAQGRYV